VCSSRWPTAGASPGSASTGEFLLEVNSYTQAKTITSFQTNRERSPGYSGTQPNILATDPATGLFVFGDVTINPGLRLVLQGQLKLGTVVEISGRFEFILSTNPFAIEIRAQASMSLFGIGSFNIDGVFRVDRDGFAAFINVSLGGGFGGNIGLSFQAGATLEIYIGSLDQKVLTKADGTTVTVLAGFRLNINGSVTFLGFASASGSVTITLQRNAFSIRVRHLARTRPADHCRAWRRRHLHRRQARPGAAARRLGRRQPVRGHQDQGRRQAAAQHLGQGAHAFGHHPAGQQLPHRLERRGQVPGGAQVQRRLHARGRLRGWAPGRCVSTPGWTSSA
jgi:hypothetical protein